MKRKLRIAAGCMAVCLMVSLGLWGLTRLVNNKYQVNKYHDFFAQEADFDVLLLGSSHMIDAVYPMELWRDQGVAAYNFGGYRNLMAVNYWILLNALEHTQPQLVVLDCFDAANTALKSAFPSFVHLALDAFPLNRTKWNAICDLYTDPADRFDFVWNFNTYHSRWSELTMADLRPVPSTEKGAEIMVGVHPPRITPLLSPDDVFNEADYIGMTYLRRIIDVCQQRDIDLLLVYLPYPATDRDQREANTITAIAEECGVPYVNLLNMGVVDYATDSYDEGSHLNVSGARKVTRWLGEHLAQHYDLPDRRTDAAYAHWAGDYAEYCQYKWQVMQQQTQLEPFLTMLGDADLDCYAWFAPDASLSPTAQRLLQNAGLQPYVTTARTVEDENGLSLVHGEETLLSLDGMQTAFVAVERSSGQAVCVKAFAGGM